MDLYKYFKIICRNQTQKIETKAAINLLALITGENWPKNLSRKID